MFKSLHELSRQGASGTSSHRGFRSLFLLLTALLLCSTVSLAATDWQARMAQCSARCGPGGRSGSARKALRFPRKSLRYTVWALPGI